MKWILLLLLPFNLYAQSESASEPLPLVINCGLESHEEIDYCSLEDKFQLIFARLYPNHLATTELQYNTPDPCDPEEISEGETCPPWDRKTGKYYYEESEYDETTGKPEENRFERLVMLNKPATSASFQGELLVWKQEKKDDYDFLQSLNMDRFRRRMAKCGYNQPNASLFKKKIADHRDLVKKDCLISHTAQLDAEDIKQAALDARIKDEAFGVSLINSILILLPDTISSTNKLLLLNHVASIERLLRLGDIDGARDLTLVTPITDDFSQSLKDFIISKCTEYLGE